MKLPTWARQNGIHPKTAYKWYRDGTMPFPTRKLGPKTIVVEVPDDDDGDGAVGLYARVSSHDQKDDLVRQMSRLQEWSAKSGVRVVAMASETASGMNGKRSKLQRLLSDPSVRTLVVERRDRLGRMNTELVEAALAADGRTLVVLDDSEVDDDLVRDVVEVLTSFCARLYGRRSARNRALRAMQCAEQYGGGVSGG